MKKMNKKIEMFLLLKEWEYTLQIWKMLDYPPHHRNFLRRCVSKEWLDVKVDYVYWKRSWCVWVLEEVYGFEID